MVHFFFVVVKRTNIFFRAGLFFFGVNFCGIVANSNLPEWCLKWPEYSSNEKKKILIDFYCYALLPSAPSRSVALSQFRDFQDFIKKSWGKDQQDRPLIEMIVKEEVILLDAALGMNIPEWCGNKPSRYLTGDNIAFLCKHRVLKVNGYSFYCSHFDPASVKFGESVYVVPNYLDLFFDVYHQQIANPYVLVTSNSDNPVPGKFGRFLDDDKIIAWFCVNLDETKHAKLYPIPLGIKNHGYGREPIDFVDKAFGQYQSLPRKNLLYMNFSIYPERRPIFELFRDKKWCLAAFGKSQDEYLRDLAQSKFVLSPRGAGLDCWRTWEALLFGSFPIVKRSSMDRAFEGLPVLIIDDWSSITKEFLEEKYIEMSQIPYDKVKIFAEYWGNKINTFACQAALSNNTA